MEVMYKDKFNCNKCLNLYGPKSEEKSLRMREQKGCFDASERPRHMIGGRKNTYGFRVHDCVGNHYWHGFSFYYDLYQKMKLGSKIFNEPITEWPNKLVEILNLIELKDTERQNEMMEEQNRKAKHGRN